MSNRKESRWYNLNTKRWIKNPPKNHDIKYSVRNHEVIGDRENIILFCKQQNLSKDMIFCPFDDIEYLIKREECRLLNTIFKVDILLTCSNVEQLINFDNIDYMNYAGLFLKCRVVKIIDGDTISVIANIPIVEISALRDGKTGFMTTNNTSGNFFTRIKCRMYGYDAPEKNTEDGKKCKFFLEEKIKSCNDIIWVLFSTIDKYGRSLILAYSDQEMKHSINIFMISSNMIKPYLGGTKK